MDSIVLFVMTYLFVSCHAMAVESTTTTDMENTMHDFPSFMDSLTLSIETTSPRNSAAQNETIQGNIDRKATSLNQESTSRVNIDHESIGQSANPKTEFSSTETLTNADVRKTTENSVTESSSPRTSGDGIGGRTNNDVADLVSFTDKIKVGLTEDRFNQKQFPDVGARIGQAGNEIRNETAFEIEKVLNEADVNSTRFSSTTGFSNVTNSVSTTPSFFDEPTTAAEQGELKMLLNEVLKSNIMENSIDETMAENASRSRDAELNPNSNRIPANQLFEWLGSIKPNRTETKSSTVTVKDVDIDTSIITTDKLVIVISTICGSFVLFVVILIIVSCCRRNKNARTDSEKSGTSEFSAVSTNSISYYDKQSSTKSKPETKNEYNDVFLGIPTNNAIWKDLETLPNTASSVMPESTKL